MNKLIFTNKAVDDLSSIWEYTVRTWSVSQAERYYNLLIDCCRMISESKITTSRRYDEVMAGLSGNDKPPLRRGNGGLVRRQGRQAHHLLHDIRQSLRNHSAHTT